MILRPPKDPVCIDDRARRDRVIFNQVEYFYSYDLYTMYSDYAAMCGCVSIVVPILGLTKEEWRPAHEARFGVAYGMEDKEWAQKTRQSLFRSVCSTATKTNRDGPKFRSKMRGLLPFQTRSSRLCAIAKGVIERLVGS